MNSKNQQIIKKIKSEDLSNQLISNPNLNINTSFAVVDSIEDEIVEKVAKKMWEKDLLNKHKKRFLQKYSIMYAPYLQKVTPDEGLYCDQDSSQSKNYHDDQEDQPIPIQRDSMDQNLKKVKIKQVVAKDKNESSGKKRSLIKSYSVLSKFTTAARKSIHEKFNSVIKQEQSIQLSQKSNESNNIRNKENQKSKSVTDKSIVKNSIKSKLLFDVMKYDPKQKEAKEEVQNEEQSDLQNKKKKNNQDLASVQKAEQFYTPVFVGDYRQNQYYQEFNKLTSEEMKNEVKFEMALAYMRKKKAIEERIKMEREMIYQEKLKKMQGKGKNFQKFDLEYTQMNDKQKKESFEQAWKYFQQKKKNIQFDEKQNDSLEINVPNKLKIQRIQKDKKGRIVQNQNFIGTINNNGAIVVDPNQKQPNDKKEQNKQEQIVPPSTKSTYTMNFTQFSGGQTVFTENQQINIQQQQKLKNLINFSKNTNLVDLLQNNQGQANDFQNVQNIGDFSILKLQGGVTLTQFKRNNESIKIQKEANNEIQQEEQQTKKIKFEEKIDEIIKNESKRQIEKQISGGAYKRYGSLSLLEYQKQKENQNSQNNIQHLFRKQMKKTKSTIENMKQNINEVSFIEEQYNRKDKIQEDLMTPYDDEPNKPSFRNKKRQMQIQNQYQSLKGNIFQSDFINISDQNQFKSTQIHRAQSAQRILKNKSNFQDLNNYVDTIITTENSKRLQSGQKLKKIDIQDSKAQIVDGAIIIKQQNLINGKDRIINSQIENRLDQNLTQLFQSDYNIKNKQQTLNSINIQKEDDKSTFHTIKNRKTSDLMNTSHIETFKQTQISNNQSLMGKYKTSSSRHNNKSASHLVNANLGPSSVFINNNQPNVIKQFKNIEQYQSSSSIIDKFNIDLINGNQPKTLVISQRPLSRVLPVKQRGQIFQKINQNKDRLFY